MRQARPRGSETAYERILDALREHGSTVTEQRSGDAMAQCPSHPDGRPSLHVTDGDDRALVWCFAECSSDDIMGALGMTRDDLFNAESTNYDYRNDTGATHRTVTRRPGKRIYQSGETAKGTAILFRLPEVREAIKAGQPVWLVEGEPDALAVSRRGQCGTTAPAGAANFRHCDITPLTGANVIAVVDNDEAGDQWAAQVQDMVGAVAESLRFVKAKVGKDSSDHFAAGFTFDDFTEYSPPDPLLDLIKGGLWLDQQDFPKLSWMVPDLIPEGFGLFTGPPKVGKSFAVLGMGLSAAMGGKALGRIPVEKKPVLYLALEDGDRRMQARCRSVLQGEPIPEDFHYITEAPEGSLFLLIERWVHRNRNRHPIVILDTLGKVMPAARAGESQYQRDYRIGGALKQVAGPGVTVMVVHHTNKTESGDWMNSTSGTNGLNGAADWTLNLARDRNSPNGIIRVTGRDVDEGEYAVVFASGSWYLDGNDLTQAEEAAQVLLESKRGSRRSTSNDLGRKIIDALNQYEEPIGPGVLGMVVGVNRIQLLAELQRLVDSGVVTRTGGGMYEVTNRKVESEGSSANSAVPVCFLHKVPITPGAGCPKCARVTDE